MSWGEFLRSHMEVLAAVDFFTAEVWTRTGCGLTTSYRADVYASGIPRGVHYTTGQPHEDFDHTTASTPIIHTRFKNLALVLLNSWVISASASEPSLEPSDVPSETPQELAEEKHNPFADEITLPLQLSSSLDVGPGNGTAGGLNFQPAIPISLGPNWKLITRPSISILDSQQPHRKLGLGDIELQTYLTPGLSEKWVWGIGPVLQAPTASEPALGTGKWSAGPGAGLFFLSGPWVNGILANHLWSFAGERDRPDVSQSTFEPVISYNFENGWFVGFDSTMTVDWNAPADKRWTIPLGMDAGKEFQIGKHALSVQFGTYYNVERAEGTARWLVRLQFEWTFPRHSASHQPADKADK